MDSCVKSLLRFSSKGAQSLTEYWYLHNRGSAGSGIVLQMIVLLVYRFYKTQDVKLFSRVPQKQRRFFVQ